MCGGTHRVADSVIVHRSIGEWSGALRSIPACAGEPNGCTPSAIPALCPLDFCVAEGSIPACAGEPHPSGLTAGDPIGPRLSCGLSPRVRGNLCRNGPQAGSMRGQKPSNMGSIPACAGEPGASWRTILTVYPRVCGGTRCTHYDAVMSAQVYPRVCGGTVSGLKQLSVAQDSGMSGLSPRVRGNPLQVVLFVGDLDGGGSIPACAGEPRAYPRRPTRG